MRSPNVQCPPEDRKVANVIIAKNFDLASHEVQIQALEVGCLMSCLGCVAALMVEWV